MSYLTAINQVLKHEGGFVNHPDDKGGPTNFGITKKVYEAFKGRSVSLDEIKKMPIADAIAIYKKNYWDEIKGDSITRYSIAFALFDQAVNRGNKASIKSAQRALNLKDDGILGPKTLEALNKIDEKKFIKDFGNDSLAEYERISKIGNNYKFLTGWQNRIDSLTEYALANASTIAISSGLIFFLIVLFIFINSSNKRKLA